MAALEENLAEAVRQFPVLYDKSCKDFKDNSKKRLDNIQNCQHTESRALFVGRTKFSHKVPKFALTFPF